MRSKRDFERRIERLELATRLGVSPEAIDLTKRDRKYFDELLEDLNDEQRQELEYRRELFEGKSRPAFSETPMISESTSYLRNSDEVVKTVLIGGVLSILSFLLIPAFIVSGYLVRVLQRTMHGNNEAPVFDDWEGLLVDGPKAFAITFVYGLVSAIVGFVLVGGGMAAAFSGDAGALIGRGQHPHR